MNNIIDQADRPAPSKLEFLTPRPETWKNYSCCPWAKSILQIDPETDDLLLTPVTCKRWGCIYCARRKIRKLAFLTHGANPNRWIRLGRRSTTLGIAGSSLAGDKPEAARVLQTDPERAR